MQRTAGWEATKGHGAGSLFRLAGLGRKAAPVPAPTPSKASLEALGVVRWERILDKL